MNKHVEFGFEIEARREVRQKGLFARRSLRSIPLARFFLGGRISDAGRLPRYALTFFLGCAAIWAPIAGYLTYAPKTWRAGATLILPGAGASSSVNLSEIGQASSSSSSPFSSSALSPTVTYKALLGSANVREAAAASLGVTLADVPKPRVKLTDQTSLIRFDVESGDAARAATIAEALLSAFLVELDKLRGDEMALREDGFRAAIGDYQASVDRTRREITRLKSETGLLSVAQYERLVEEADKLEILVRDTEAAAAQRRNALTALVDALAISPEMAARLLRLASDPEFRSVSAEMAEKAAATAIARGAYGSRHPKRVAAEDALSGARARAYAIAARITGLSLEETRATVDFSGDGERGALLAEMVRTKSECDGLEARLEQYSGELTVARDRVRALVGAASRLDDLDRDYQVAEAVFASALARTDTTKTDIYASYPLVQVLETPEPPREPSSPHVMIALAGGAAATMLLLGALLLGWLRRPLIDRLIAPRREPEA